MPYPTDNFPHAPDNPPRTVPNFAREFFYVISGDDVIITGYRGIPGDVVIPATIDEKRVASIGSGAFYQCDRITRVTIPDGVTSIGDAAFAGCRSLISVIMPDSVIDVGNNAFGGCDQLIDVKLSNSLKSIGDQAFASCSSLTNMTIPGSVESIGDGIFNYCGSLASITVLSIVMRKLRTRPDVLQLTDCRYS